MDSTTGKSEASRLRHPLIAIGAVILVMLTIPGFLYSLAPEGPVKEGDAAFSTGKHRVYLVDPVRYRQFGYVGYCILEPRDQVVIIQISSEHSDGSLLARPVGRTTIEAPYCPPHAEIHVLPHQVSLTTSLWGEIKASLGHWFTPR